MDFTYLELLSKRLLHVMPSRCLTLIVYTAAPSVQQVSSATLGTLSHPLVMEAAGYDTGSSLEVIELGDLEKMAAGAGNQTDNFLIERQPS